MCEERREGENGREGGRERAGDAEKGTRVWMSCVWGRAGGKVRGRESAGRTRWVVGSASVFLGGVYPFGRRAARPGTDQDVGVKFRGFCLLAP